MEGGDPTRSSDAPTFRRCDNDDDDDDDDAPSPQLLGAKAVCNFDEEGQRNGGVGEKKFEYRGVRVRYGTYRAEICVGAGCAKRRAGVVGGVGRRRRWLLVVVAVGGPLGAWEGWAATRGFCGR